MLAATVTAGVGQSFLNDTEDRVLQDRLKTFGLDLVLKVDMRSAAHLIIFDQCLHGGDDAEFIEYRRPHTADQAARLGQAVSQGLVQFTQRGIRFFRRPVDAVFGCLALIESGHQLLGQPVMDLVCDQLAFLIV